MKYFISVVFALQLVMTLFTISIIFTNVELSTVDHNLILLFLVFQSITLTLMIGDKLDSILKEK